MEGFLVFCFCFFLSSQLEDLELEAEGLFILRFERGVAEDSNCMFLHVDEIFTRTCWLRIEILSCHVSGMGTRKILTR